MAIYHQNLTVRRPAGQDFEPAAEGCFVVLEAPAVALAAAATKPEEVYGLLTDVAEESGEACHIALPGYAGIVGVRVSADGEAVEDGDILVLADGGAVKGGSDGTAVAVALAHAEPGKLVEARLVQPYTAGGAAALAAAAPVAVAAPVAAATATATKKTSTK